MATKDLTAYLTPDLVLPLGGHTYTVKPPSRDVGLKLAAIVSMGMQVYIASTGTCPTCGRSGNPEFDPETKALVDSLGQEPLGNLSLGKAVMDQMEADGLPEAHQDTAAQYAMYYWTMGEDTADAVMNPDNVRTQASIPKA